MNVTSRLFLLLVLLPCTARASRDEIGNGGNVVVCHTPNGDTLRVLDVYEAESQGLAISLGEPSLDYLQKVNLAIRRIEPIDPRVAAEYDDILGEFIASIRFTSDDLDLLNDAGAVTLASHCELKQIAVQKYVRRRFEYHINQTLWNRLDSDNKAALVLHELTIREYVSRDLSSTIGNTSILRRYNEKFLITEGSRSLSQAAYFRMIVDEQFGMQVANFQSMYSVKYGGVGPFINAVVVDRYPSGSIKKAFVGEVVSSAEVESNFYLGLAAFSSSREEPFLTTPYYETLYLGYRFLPTPANAGWGGLANQPVYSNDDNCGFIEFHENGHYKSFCFLAQHYSRPECESSWPRCDFLPYKETIPVKCSNGATRDISAISGRIFFNSDGLVLCN